ncbi:MAG: hypothetical protein ABIP95_11785 [Pelobium sp.]
MKKIFLIAISFSFLAITSSCKKDSSLKPQEGFNNSSVSNQYILDHKFTITSWVSAENGDIRIWKLMSGNKVITIDPVPADTFWKYTEGDTVPSVLLAKLYK